MGVYSVRFGNRRGERAFDGSSLKEREGYEDIGLSSKVC